MRRFLILAVLAVSGALLVPSVASAAFKFEGRTSQCPPELGGCYTVNILLPSNLGKVSRFTIFWEAPCNSGAKITNANTVATGVPLSRRLKFNDSGTYSVTLDAARGLSGNVSATLSGKFRRSANGSGAFNASVAVVNAAGQQVDQCDTGQVTWRVKIAG